jgi:RNA polymerase sigma-70 factor (ECF subfamily)
MIRTSASKAERKPLSECTFVFIFYSYSYVCHRGATAFLSKYRIENCQNPPPARERLKERLWSGDTSDGETVNEAANRFLPTRRSLLSKLRKWDDDLSWRRFFDLYWKLIYGTALKAGLTDSEAQEVVQETVLAVAKNMPAFRYDPAVCSFKGWLLHLTRRRIADEFRKRQRAARLGQRADTVVVEQVPDPVTGEVDAAWETDWRNHLLEAATANVRRRIKPKQYQIFDLYVLRNWRAAEVARALQVNVAQVYLARHRVAALIRNEVRLLEKRMG